MTHEGMENMKIDMPRLTQEQIEENIEMLKHVRDSYTKDPRYTQDVEDLDKMIKNLTGEKSTVAN